MVEDEEAFEQERRALLKALVTTLEEGLPEGTPARTSGERTVRHVLVDTAADAAPPLLASIEAGAGGELRPTDRGQLPMASAESSALMAVNFLAPFGARGGRVLGLRCNTLSVERELRVAGVRAPVGPTLDAVVEGPDGTLCVEAKCAEPWRGRPKAELSVQYDGPAAAVSRNTRRTLESLRSGDLTYLCLDAAQLFKHLLGVHSALNAGALAAPATLTLLCWRPRHAGRFSPLFDRLETELDDFAGRVADQPVAVTRVSTAQLLDAWSAPDAATWEHEHARALAARYDRALLPA